MATSAGDVHINLNNNNNNNVTDGEDSGTERPDEGQRLQQEAEASPVPFVPSKLYSAAKWTLDLLDAWGERLAFAFGITSPKYAVHINAHNRMLRQDESRTSHQENEFSGWRASGLEPPAHGYENPAANTASGTST